MARAEHGVEGNEELSHDGNDCLERCFAALDELISEGFECWVVASGGHSRHEESFPEEAIAGF